MATKTTVGVFHTRAAAEQAITDLKTAGYRDDQIGLVAKNAEGKTVRTDGGDNAAEGAAIGAAAGAGALALGSLGVSLGIIPVVGPVLAVGTLAAALISGAAGAAAGTLVGADRLGHSGRGRQILRGRGERRSVSGDRGKRPRPGRVGHVHEARRLQPLDRQVTGDQRNRGRAQRAAPARDRLLLPVSRSS